jgi:hypothetical protein
MKEMNIHSWNIYHHISNEIKDVHKQILKKEHKKELIDILREELQEKIQNLRNTETTTWTQRGIQQTPKWNKGKCYKKKKRNTWNKKAQDMKEEFNKDMENLRKKNETKIPKMKSS